LFECFVKLTIEEADFCFVLCIMKNVNARTKKIATEMPTKTNVSQGFAIVVQYPVVMIKVYYEIGGLERRMRMGLRIISDIRTLAPCALEYSLRVSRSG